MDNLRRFMQIAYGCFLFYIIFSVCLMLTTLFIPWGLSDGLLPWWFSIGNIAVLVGTIITLVKRKEATSTIYESHCSWILRTVVIVLVGGAIINTAIMALLPTELINMLYMPVQDIIFLWILYRFIKGVKRFLKEQPIENPKALI
jgi:uncharacterized membrane protein